MSSGKEGAGHGKRQVLGEGQGTQLDLGLVLWEGHHGFFDTCRSPSPEAKTNVACFKEPSQEEEDHEMEDLMRRMHGLSVHEECGVTVLFTHGVPTDFIPKPCNTCPPPAHFSIQAPALPPPPVSQPWPVVASPPPIQHLTFDPSPFFLPCVRAERCSFRLQLREFPTAQEYVRSGYALSWATCFNSPTASLFPNNGAGHGLKHTINAWFAAQSQVVPTPAQQVSFTHGALPHVPPAHGNRAPSIHIEEKMETHMCR